MLAVLPEGACPLAEAGRILTYLAAETAGQCGPCVNGLTALDDKLARIASSRPAPDDLAWVWRWMDMVRGRGGCHHPDGAVGQLNSVLTAFEDHLQMHLRSQRCPGVGVAGFPRPPRPGKGWR